MIYVMNDQLIQQIESIIDKEITDAHERQLFCRKGNCYLFTISLNMQSSLGQHTLHIVSDFLTSISKTVLHALIRQRKTLGNLADL